MYSKTIKKIYDENLNKNLLDKAEVFVFFNTSVLPCIIINVLTSDKKDNIPLNKD